MNKIGRTIRRRRREGKTDYRARLDLLKSDSPRLVVRKTNRYIIAQIVQNEVAEDKVIMGVNSRDLESYGWPKDKEGSLKNMTAAYLTGFLLAKKSAKTKKAILDLGPQRNAKKGRLFSVMKGALDGGMEIPCDKKSLPSEENLDSSLLKIVKEKINNG